LSAGVELGAGCNVDGNRKVDPAFYDARSLALAQHVARAWSAFVVGGMTR
jgi:hypothetical protein